MSNTSSVTARRDVNARVAAVSSSPNVAESSADVGIVDSRIQLLGQLRAAMYSLAEHSDQFSRGWNCGVAYAVRALFPLPVPTYSCRFPTDDVSRGLRELASAAFAGVVAVDLSDCGDR